MELNDIKALTVRDLQTTLSIGRDKAYALMHSPSFPSTKLGGQYIVSAKALSNWLDTYKYKQFDL